MMAAIFDENGLAEVDCSAMVYSFHSHTREYICSNEEFIPSGVGLPAYSALDAPLSPKAGFAVCRKTDNSGWEYLPDHRGDVVYSTETGQPIEITMPGSYPDNTTPLKPKTPYDDWNGSEWVTDVRAAHAAEVAKADTDKNNRLNVAKKKISLWQTQLQLGMISDTDKTSLIAWMNYITALQAVDTSTAPEIDWPTPPDA